MARALGVPALALALGLPGIAGEAYLWEPRIRPSASASLPCGAPSNFRGCCAGRERPSAATLPACAGILHAWGCDGTTRLCLGCRFHAAEARRRGGRKRAQARRKGSARRMNFRHASRASNTSQRARMRARGAQGISPSTHFHHNTIRNQCRRWP